MKSAKYIPSSFALFACLVFSAGFRVPAAVAGDLERGFADPPAEARPWVFWFRMDGQIDRDGITRDFEEMKAKGIGGLLQWDNLTVGVNVAKPPLGVRWLDPQWWALFRHTVSEADRLGLGLSVQLCWCINCGGPWIKPEHTLQHIVWSEASAAGPGEVAVTLPKAKETLGFYRDIAVVAFRRENSKPGNDDPLRNWIYKSGVRKLRNDPLSIIDEPDPEDSSRPPAPRDSVVDLTADMDSAGRLRWRAPEGNWTILRIGHTADERSRTNSFIPPDLGGLEVNYLDREAMDRHFHELPEKLIAAAGPAAGRTLRYLHVDSLEIAPTRWTDGFREEFRRRRGYDMLPYLPVLVGKLVESREVSNRFLWDYRRTLADLTAENHYGRLQELAEKRGLGTDCEAGGPYVMTLDALECLGKCVVPMGEIWLPAWGGDKQLYNRLNSTKQAASAAHVRGRPLAAAEACTSIGPHWEEGPAELKPVADLAFCNGINRLYLHTFTHSPAAWGKPGLEYFAGSHQNPNVTWWEQSGGWFRYLGRCQYLLQRGQFVADACYFYGEGAPNYLVSRHLLQPAMPDGYDYDGIGAETLLNRMDVRDGRLVLPDGMSYRLLVLPATDRMTPAVLTHIKRLVEDGATVLGTTRPLKSPGLTDYPRCDETVARLAAELWGDWDGKSAAVYRVGRGRMVCGTTMKEALESLDAIPDFEVADKTEVRYIHRRDGDTDVYFVANPHSREVVASCRFRVIGKQPELWDALSGTARPAVAFRQADGRTTVPLEFAPHASLFVVFRKPIPATAAGTAPGNYPTYKTFQELDGPWTVEFDPKWGGPERPVVFNRLDDWTKRPETGIKHYSGTATYRKTFDLRPQAAEQGSRTYLDLGAVKEVAAARLNGKPLGAPWCPPWRLDVTDALRAKDNVLEIDVVNLWPNRLIGDGKLPPEKRFTKTNVRKFLEPPKGGGEHALLSSGLLGPVTLQTGHLPLH